MILRLKRKSWYVSRQIYSPLLTLTKVLRLGSNECRISNEKQEGIEIEDFVDVILITPRWWTLFFV